MSKLNERKEAPVQILLLSQDLDVYEYKVRRPRSHKPTVVRIFLIPFWKRNATMSSHSNNNNNNTRNRRLNNEDIDNRVEDAARRRRLTSTTIETMASINEKNSSDCSTIRSTNSTKSNVSHKNNMSSKSLKSDKSSSDKKLFVPSTIEIEDKYLDEKDKCSVPLDERPDVQPLPTPPLDAIPNTTEPPPIPTITAVDGDDADAIGTDQKIESTVPPKNRSHRRSLTTSINRPTKTKSQRSLLTTNNASTSHRSLLSNASHRSLHSTTSHRSSPTRSRPNMMLGPYGTSNRSLISDISSDRGDLVVSEDRLVLKPPPTRISYSSSSGNNSPSGGGPTTKKTTEGKRLSGNTGYTSSTTIATTTSLRRDEELRSIQRSIDNAIIETKHSTNNNDDGGGYIGSDNEVFEGDPFATVYGFNEGGLEALDHIAEVLNRDLDDTSSRAQKRHLLVTPGDVKRVERLRQMKVEEEDVEEASTLWTSLFRKRNNRKRRDSIFGWG